MSKLLSQQIRFMQMVGQLIWHAYHLGYGLSGGNLWAHDGHKEGSFHYKRLAIDLNLFKEGSYLESTEAHRPLGEYWESIGGTWGGRWGDGNHYSYGE